jgi:hypothetical protein
MRQRGGPECLKEEALQDGNTALRWMAFLFSRAVWFLDSTCSFVRFGTSQKKQFPAPSAHRGASSR